MRRVDDHKPNFAQAAPILFESLLGLALGYLLLHPMVMVIFALFGTHNNSGTSRAVAHAFLSSFAPNMVPMAFAFSLLAAALGGIDGAYRVRLKQEERRLAGQLEETRVYRARAERRAEKIAELERSRRNQSRFLVHDLKTHASCVLGYAHYLMSAEPAVLAGRQRDAIDRIHRQAARILEGALDLLDLDRLESGAALSVGAVAPAELLSSAVERAGLMPSDACVVVTERSNQCPPVSADRDLLERALANLVRNAIRHNSIGVMITLDAGLAAHGEDLVLVCEDNGRGFNRPRSGDVDGHRSTGRANGVLEPSYGLGLRFCEAVAIAHHGEFAILDAVPRGTRAELRIPREAVKQDGEYGNR